MHKTQILSYNFTPNAYLKGKFDFKWDTPAIKYLGVWIPKDISKIYKTNYDPVTKTVKADLD